MTLLAASIWVEELGSARRAADAAFSAGADAVELRIDAFDGDPLAVADWLKQQKDRKWIITCRSALFDRQSELAR